MTTIEAPTPVVTEADVLERAADIIEEWGWTQGAFFRSRYGVYDLDYWAVDDHRIASYCGIGAIWRAAHDLGLAPATWKGMMDAAGGEDGEKDPYDPLYEATGLTSDETVGLLGLNDGDSGSKWMVVNVLRAIAADRRSSAQTEEDSLERKRNKAI